jgi:hypothetical protein
LLLLDALVEGHLVAHPTPNLVDPVIVAVTEKVIIRNKPENIARYENENYFFSTYRSKLFEL